MAIRESETIEASIVPNLTMNVTNAVAFNDGPTIEVTDGETADGTPAVSTIDENMPGLLLGSITVSDPDQDLTADNISTSDQRFVIWTDDDGGLWLALADGVSLDHETEPTVDVTVTVTDDEGATAEQTVTITVNDVNEPPEAPEVTPGVSNLMVEENSVFGVNLALLTSEDPEDDALTFAVDNEDFEIQMFGSVAILKLKDNVALDREATQDGTVTLMVTALDDSGNTSDPTEVVVTITNVNEPPSGEDSSGAATAGVDQAATGNVTASDIDWDDTLSYAVGTDTSNGTLTVDAAGAWSYSLDQADEAVVALAQGATMEDTGTIMITDAGGLSAEVSVTITITGINENPTGEDGIGGVTAGFGATANGNVNAADVDDGDTHTFAVGTAATLGMLEVDQAGAWTYTLDDTNAAVIALAEGATMEDTGTVVITDNNGGSAEVNVTITVTGVNEDPTGENTSGMVTVGGDAATGNVSAMDVDVGDTHSFAVGTLPAFGMLEVDAMGDWTYTLDETNATVVALAEGAEVQDGGTIVITDNNGGSVTVSVSITVVGSNDNPTITVVDGATPDGTPAVSTINENAAGLPVASVVVSDPDQTLDASHVSTSDPDRFVIKTDALGGLWLALADGVSLNHEEEATVDVTVTVTDDQGASAEQTVTITVSDIDEAPDAPVVTPAASNFRIVENDASGENLAELTAQDPEGGSVTFGVDNDDFEIEVVGSAALLKVKDGVALDREATADGTITLSVTASDASGNTSEATEVVITVLNVNEGPSISVADGETPDGDRASSVIAENTTGFVAAITVSDPEQTFDADDITVDDDRFSIYTDRLGGLWLVLDEGVDAESEQTVTVELQVVDDYGLAARVDVTITIAEVNEIPTIEVTDSTTPDGVRARAVISENETGPVGLISIADPDEQLDASNITLSDPRFGTMTDQLGGIWLVLNEAADYETDGDTITVTVTVTDSQGLSAQADVTVAVVEVNEAPTISVMDGETADGVEAVAAISEGATGYVGAITVSDPEESLGADDITLDDDRFVVEADAFGGIWLVLNEGVDADSEDTVTVELEVIDSGGLTASTEVTVNIIGVNEIPGITVTDGTTPDGINARRVINENETGPIGLITLTDPEDDLDASNVTLSDLRFGTETDQQGDIWLVLNDAANYETDGGTISVTVTVTDSQGLSSEVVVDLTVVDVNDAPQANQDGVLVITQDATNQDPQVVEAAVDLFATAGMDAVQIKLNLGDMFSDEDGDSIFRYGLENAPSWLSLVNVQYADDGSVTGELAGTVPPGTDTSALDIRLVATDQGGAQGSTVFNLIVDDGNDGITALNLLNQDGTENAFKSVEIAENDTSGIVIGMLTADDLDHPRHPNGMHTFEVAPAFQAQFEAVQQGDDWILKVKDGVALDFEAGDTIEVQVTAKDGGGSSLTQVVTVNLTDNNDAPRVKNEPGNWWVTVDDSLDDDDVMPGDWLSFSLETGADARALFEDVDANDTLTYSIVSGPAWLEIDENSGALQNKAGMIPTRGVYDVTVQATDEAGAQARASFKIALVLSGPNDQDNSEPDIKSDGVDITEIARPGAVVATITVEDEDLDVAGIHPWGDLTIVVSATADVGTQTDVVIQSAADFMDDDATNDFFALEKVSENQDSVTYNIVLTEAAFEGENAINAESYSEVELTVTAYDGTVTVPFASIDSNTDGADIADFDFEIEDVNEAPALDPLTLDNDHTSDPLAEVDDAYVYPVEQQQDADTNSAVHSIYLNLSELFEDPDEDHDDGDFTLTASISSTPWLKMARHWNSDSERFTTGVVKWEDIKDGRDEDANTADDVAWGPNTDPDDDDFVLILEVDRTGNDPVQGGTPTPDPSEIRQDANGLITIRARDEDGATSTTNIAVTITDENLNPGADGSDTSGVRISDTTPHEKDTITVSFNQNVDPDFTGSGGGRPVAVIYQVINVEGGGQGAETILDASVDNSIRYSVQQTDVGDEIQGKVVYFELFDGSIVPSEADNTALDTNTSLVGDRQDPASISFTFQTNASDQLVATTSAQNTWDPDGLPDSPSITYRWESSANGRGGWTEFDANGDPNTADTTDATIPSSVSGNFVRLVVSFTDANGISERVASSPIKVGTIDTIAAGDVPTIDSGGQTGDVPVGRTLRIDLADATPTDGTATAEWLADDVVVGTGTQYRITDADRGKAITVRITSRDEDGNVTSIVNTQGRDTVAAPVNSGPISPEDAVTIDLGAAPAEEGQLKSLTTTVAMATLFEDIEGGLTFSFASPTNFGADSVDGEASLDVYYDGNTGDGDGDQLLIVDEATGAIRYYTTMSHTHDDQDTDGQGNLVVMVLTANDAAANNGGGATDTVNVQLRIDVAPTDVEVGTPAVLTETAEDDDAPDMSTDVATIDVQDQNVGSHAYGQYTFRVDDERFEVVVDETDGSMATLRLKEGQKLDFEAIPGEVNGSGNKVIELVVTATPASGNFEPVTATVEVEVSNVTSDDPSVPDLGMNMVPGLKDDETGADDDDTTDDATDDDEDGGTPVPMDALAGFVSILDDGMF